jgi:aspartate aminotransferase
MTGWRIGFMAAPLAVAKAVSCFQDQVTSNPTSFAQKGAIAALKMDDGAVCAMRDEFHARRDLAMSELAKIPNLVVPKPDGAFYLFVGVGAYLGGSCATDADLAEKLLEEGHVAVVPGSVFEGPGFLRLSYTASQEDIVRGIGRIGETLARIA